MDVITADLRRTYGVGIVYHDGDTVIANKPRGIVTRSRGGGLSLQDCIRVEYGNQSYCPVHRLDKDTSGLVAGAINERTRSALAYQFFGEGADRLYLGLVDGRIPVGFYHDMRCCLRYDSQTRRAYADSEGGKEARTELIVLDNEMEGRESTSLLLLKIHTGRTHQIRAQLSNLGYPVCGDTKYNPHAFYRNEQMLHAACLHLDIPGRGVETFVSLPKWLPTSMHDSIENVLRHYAGKTSLKDEAPERRENLLMVA